MTTKVDSKTEKKTKINKIKTKINRKTNKFDDIKKARVVISNYHAFQLREKISLSKGNRQLLQGQTGPEIKTTETEGQMLQRAVPELLGMKNVVVINDEAHHCYREKPESIEEKLTGDDKKEAKCTREDSDSTLLAYLCALNFAAGSSCIEVPPVFRIEINQTINLSSEAGSPKLLADSSSHICKVADTLPTLVPSVPVP